MNWLLLLHQVPPKPAYFRAKVLRRLNQLGALPIKNSAYLLPAGDETLEDFQWLRREIVQEGGEAWVFQTGLAAGLSDQDVMQSFRELRAPDYAALIEDGRKLLAAPNNHQEAEWRRLKRRAEEVRRIDFFGAAGSQELESLMNTIDRTLHPQPADSPPAEFQGRTWVTRRGVKVDRIGSAWLIRRFLDPAARFVFVDPGNYVHSPEELRFDMFEGEFTHQGDLCTFEVLLERSGLADPALRAIAEMVHDIDLKDHKFQRAETAGVAGLIEGLALRHAEDMRRLEEGAVIFDALYARMEAESHAAA